MKEIRIPSPFLNRATDKDEVTKVFNLIEQKTNKVIMPYFGNNNITSHTYLNVLSHTYLLSPSARACAKWLVRNAIGGEGGDVCFVNKRKAGKKTKKKAKPLKGANLRSVEEWWEGLGFSYTDFAKYTCELERNNYIPSGDHYLRIRMVNVKGKWKGVFKVENYLKTAVTGVENLSQQKYIATTEHEWRLCGKSLKVEFTKESEIGKPFNWQKKGKDIYETIVHVKNSKDSASYYGNSELIDQVNNMYAEFQKGNQLAKSEQSAMNARYLLESVEEIVEIPRCQPNICNTCKGKGCGSDMINDREDVADSLRSLTTVEGESPADIALNFVRNKESFSKLLKFDVERDSQWLKISSDYLTESIHASFNIPPELTKRKTVSGGLNETSHLIMLIDTNNDVVKPTRKRWHNYWNFVINELAILTKRVDLQNVGIEFEDSVKPVIKQIKKIKGNAKNTNNTNRNN